MLNKIINRDEIINSLQISHLENVTGAITREKYFLIKNLGETKRLKLRLAGEDSYIETAIYTGWNPEICSGVKDGTDSMGSDIQIGY